MNKIRDALPLLLMAGFAVICLAALKWTGAVERIDLPALRDWIKSIGIWGPLLYMLAYALRPLIFFPATPLTLFGGYTFGVLWGTIYDVIGAGAGALLAYAIARKLGRGSVEKLIAGKKIQRFDDKARDHGFSIVLLMRVVPLFPFDGVNYGAGLANIRFRDYAPATFIGIIPGALILNNFGSSFNDPGSSRFYAALSIYLAFLAIPLVYRYVRKKRKPPAIKTPMP